MSWSLALLLYRLLLPVLFIAAFPGWVIKMLRRDGMGTGLFERIGFYSEPDEFEPFEAIHIHSVSVGETLLADAAALECDLLVLGGYSRSRFREMVFGGVTRHVLNDAELPVLLAH